MYIHCNFCLNLHITHGDMEENVSGCFFSEHSVHCLSDFTLLSVTDYSTTESCWILIMCFRPRRRRISLTYRVEFPWSRSRRQTC